MVVVNKHYILRIYMKTVDEQVCAALKLVFG
jgi:hypothetical protein